MDRILIIFGTRPETIKLAPVIEKLKMKDSIFNTVVATTGQHREMVNLLLDFFNLQVDYNFNIMEEDQSLVYITKSVLKKTTELIRRINPSLLIVQGDTTTAFAASLSAFYNKVKIAHIEAGLRTGDKYNPFPEEMNRKFIDSISDICFAPTVKSATNLINEGIKNSKIEVTGNTVIDAINKIAGSYFDLPKSEISTIPFGRRKIILVTVHRRENYGVPLSNICTAIKDIAKEYNDGIHFVIPVHPNPNISKLIYSNLSDIKNISLIDPLNYITFVHLMKRSYMILTDSGGLQEEAPSLGKPVLILRKTTERPEGVEVGNSIVVGTEVKRIRESIKELLNNEEKYNRMAQIKNPYGDGNASKRIVSSIENYIKNIR